MPTNGKEIAYVEWIRAGRDGLLQAIQDKIETCSFIVVCTKKT